MIKDILIVDDDEDELIFWSSALDELRIVHTTTWVKNGEDAVKQLQNVIPDIIFVDYNMPRMNGVKCIYELKKNVNVGHVPIILHSAGMSEALKKEGLEAGAFACIKKPSSLKEFKTVLSDIFMMLS